MMRLAIILALVALAGCAGRPMTPGEVALANDIFGPGLDTEAVRVRRGFQSLPAGEDPPLPDRKPVRIRPGVCDRVAPSPRIGPPAAWALYDNVHFSEEFYRGDLAPGWPDSVLLPQSLILAHELVHVWQWQNRRITGYRPGRAALESILNADPYFYVPEPGEGFLRYGFEQQASLVEDYMCYGLFDPANPRRAELRAILAPYFRMDRFDAVLERPRS